METFIREYMLSDPSICDGLVELFRKAVTANLVAPGGVGPQAQVEPATKRSTDLSIGVAEKHFNMREFRFDAYLNEVYGFINSYIAELLYHGGSFKIKHPPQIQWYQPGEGFYAWHIDGAHGSSDRALVFTSYLNDVTDGGGTEFHYQRMVTSAVKGKTVIFPAALTHLHRGVVSPTQHKYILTGWLWWA